MDHTSLTIKELRRETDDYLSIVFEKPQGFIFNAGDCLDLFFPEDKRREKKTFSFASSPTEDDLLVTFKKGFSEYKKRMENVKLGEIMLATQYGSNFVFDPNLDSVFFAGGVGIAPFRSMIKWVVDSAKKTEITLVYLNKLDHFPFKDELDNWGSSESFLKVHYIATGIDGRLTKERVQKLIFDISKDNKTHYIVGSPGMVDATEDVLVELGVQKSYIRTDSFDGYFEEA